MKKIVSYITNGLGNQMFQYAAGYALSKMHNMEFVLNTQWFHQNTSRTFDLESFNIITQSQNGFTPDIHISDAEPNRRHTVERIALSDKKSYGIHGYWMHANRFIDVVHDIKDQFTLRHTTKIEQLKSDILHTIRTTNSIFVHVRRTDFLSNKSRQVGTPTYYKHAIAEIINNTNNPHLVFFSDDIDWVRNNMTYNVPTMYIEPGTTEEDFYLMSQCKHGVIPNSSFSWWAAFLNQNPNKIIIYPKKWKTTHTSNTLSNGVPEEWKKSDK